MSPASSSEWTCDRYSKTIGQVTTGGMEEGHVLIRALCCRNHSLQHTEQREELKGEDMGERVDEDLAMYRMVENGREPKPRGCRG